MAVHDEVHPNRRGFVRRGITNGPPLVGTQPSVVVPFHVGGALKGQIPVLLVLALRPHHCDPHVSSGGVAIDVGPTPWQHGGVVGIDHDVPRVFAVKGVNVTVMVLHRHLCKRKGRKDGRKDGWKDGRKEEERRTRKTNKEEPEGRTKTQRTWSKMKTLTESTLHV